MLLKVLAILLLFYGTAFSQSLDQTYVAMHNPLLNGADCTAATLQAAIVAVGSSEKTIYLTATDRNKAACTWNINTSVTVPANIRLSVPHGAQATIAAGQLLRIEGCLDADDPTWYTGDGLVDYIAVCQDDPALWMGAGFNSYVQSGCKHTTSANSSASVNACIAWMITDTGRLPRLERVEEVNPVIINYTGGDNTYYLLLRYDSTMIPAGWTCIAGTHYCWQASATQPATPSKTLMLMRSVVTTGAISSVEFLPYNRPDDWSRAEYAARHGMVCDGVTDNTNALLSAYNALPSTGGILVLPASSQPCLFGTTFAITKSITLQGSGGTRAGPATPRTILRYTGITAAITISGLATQGAKLVGFELSNNGPAEYGVKIDNTSAILLDDFSIVLPPVPFTIAGVAIGENNAVTAPHSIYLQDSYLRGSAPTGVWVVRGTEYIVMTNNKILRHVTNNVLLGRLSSPGPAGTVTDVHILHNTLESQEPGSNAIRINRAEGVWIKDNHFEIGPPDGSLVPGRALLINTSTERAAPIHLEDNKFTAITGATEVIAINFASGLVEIEGNYFVNASGGTLTTYIVNTLAKHIIFGKNRLDPAPAYISSPANVTYTGNWDIAVGRLDAFWPYRVCQSGGYTGNVGTGEDVLATCTLAGDTLFKDGRGLHMTFGGDTAANANTKRIRVYMAAVLIWDSTVLAANDDDWYVSCDGLRTTASGMRVICRGKVHDIQPSEIVTLTDVTITSWLDPKDITVTGEATANNDIRVGPQTVHVIP